MTEQTVTEQPSAPKRKAVNIVAMGGSRDDYLSAMLIDQRPEQVKDAETWTINYMGGLIPCDRVISVDPLRHMMHVPPVRDYVERTHKLGIPVYTSDPMPEYPNQVMFPFHKLHAFFNSTYFNTSVAYAFCMAVMEGFTDIGLFGCDFTYPNIHVGESGRACVEYWIGTATARGIRVAIGQRSTLMDIQGSVDFKGSRTQQPYGFFVDTRQAPSGSGKLMTPEEIIKVTSEWKPQDAPNIVQLSGVR